MIKAITQTQHMISAYNLTPANNEVYVVIFVKYNYFTYSIPLRILAEYHQADKNHTIDVMQSCEKRIKFVGLS